MEVLLGASILAAIAVLVGGLFFKSRNSNSLMKFDFDAAKSRETKHGSQLS